jgi:hypothetical protein
MHGAFCGWLLLLLVANVISSKWPCALQPGKYLSSRHMCWVAIMALCTRTAGGSPAVYGAGHLRAGAFMAAEETLSSASSAVFLCMHCVFDSVLLHHA